ncbi:DUF4868 domain-containing protein [Grimontia hollisae]|uniref:anti-phage protein KwaB n=1 Tax=Grimontia hollisae TaxID=673 RepID=UPI0023DBF9E2|nr:anti-phage protein KwaB [Grimontia hollisae]MDF2185682.1 DUF4868 domain-containing protein [Grimontia hollisae]
MSKFKTWLEDFINGCDGIAVYFVDDANQIHDSDIDSKVLAKFRTAFCQDLRKKYTDSDDFEVEKLSTFEERPHTLYGYDFSPREMPLEFKLTKNVLDIKPTDTIPKYQVKANKLSGIRGAIVLLTKGISESIAFYQHIFPVSLLGPDKGVLNLTTHATRLIELESDVLKLNTKFVFMQCTHGYFVENVGVLETNLHFKKAINTRAKKYAGEILSMGLVEDTTVILERIEKEPTYAKKLISAYKNSMVISQKIPISDMITFAQKKEYYSKYLKPSKNGKSLVVDGVTKSKRFLELLNDNFLKSELTNTEYLARSKKAFK